MELLLSAIVALLGATAFFAKPGSVPRSPVSLERILSLVSDSANTRAVGLAKAKQSHPHVHGYIMGRKRARVLA
ncbi:hypothetical protein Rruber_05588 (plasmid) [Rhodococcus ruber]